MTVIDEEQRYITVDNKRLKRGHTTGTSAAAASKAAAVMLLGGEKVEIIRIMTPKGLLIEVPIEDITISEDFVICAVRKDGGDDIDATHGSLIYSTVSKILNGIEVDGGVGVGRVTKKGLDQPVGNAAINRVPRIMIKEALEDVSSTYAYNGGLKAVISIPDGEEIAEKTFNGRLGILGGISVLGTSGIVEPMSEKALVDTIRVELKMNLENGNGFLFVVPGNYGKDFAEKNPDICKLEPVKCSNFVGDTLDMSIEYGAKGLLLVGNLGKMVKLGGGVMNTHSKFADCRMEILASNAIVAGAEPEIAKKIMTCISTDEALEVLDGVGMIEATMKVLLEKIDFHLKYRVRGAMKVGAVVYSTEYGLLGETSDVPELIEGLKDQVKS